MRSVERPDVKETSSADLALEIIRVNYKNTGNLRLIDYVGPLIRTNNFCFNRELEVSFLSFFSPFPTYLRI